MQTRTHTPFTTIKTEGALLPADLLQRIAAGSAEGLLPQDYHLAPGELRELVAFLADEDGQIRWLAGGTVARLANQATVTVLGEFLDGVEAERVERARSEIKRVLGMIRDTAEEDGVKATVAGLVGRV